MTRCALSCLKQWAPNSQTSGVLATFRHPQDECRDKVTSIHGGRWNDTFGCFWIHCSHFHQSQNMLTAQKPCLGILFLRHRSGDTIQGMAKSWVFSKSFFPWQLKFYWMLSFILEDTFTPKDCLDLLDAFIPGKDNDCCVKDCQWYGTEVGTSSLGQRRP